MKVIYNGETYQNVTWNGNGFSMETTMTLAQLEIAFSPTTESIINLYDGDTEIGRYYNKGISSMTVAGTDPRIVTIEFDITQISENAEEAILSSIEDSDGAIVELAEAISEISESMEVIDAFNERAAGIEQNIQDVWKSIRNILERLDALESHNESNDEPAEEEQNNG